MLAIKTKQSLSMLSQTDLVLNEDKACKGKFPHPFWKWISVNGIETKFQGLCR